MKLRIIRNIDDEFLQMHWKRLSQKYECFPQSSYEWCAAWWRYLGAKRKLYVPIGVDRVGEVVGVAPMCLERQFGATVLRSFPIHFGDYYQLVVVDDTRADYFHTALITHMRTFAEWDVARFDQVNDHNNGFFERLRAQPRVETKFLTKCVFTEFAGMTWEEYVKTLKRNHRRNLKKRIAKLEVGNSVELKSVESPEEFLEYLPRLRSLYRQRWKDDYVPQKSSRILDCEREALANCFKQNIATLYLLLVNAELAGYVIGFPHRSCFHCWQSSYNLRFARYSVGTLIHGYMIRELIADGYNSIDFMAGEYDWKLQWSPQGRTTSTFMFLLNSGRFRSRLLAKYCLSWRDTLKQCWHPLLSRSSGRKLACWLISLRQKLEGGR